MTLRARLAVGFALMTAVMAFGAFALAVTIVTSQDRQLDMLISDTLPDVARSVPATGETGGLGAVGFGQLYVARIEPDGTRREIAQPTSGNGESPQLPAGASGSWFPATGTDDAASSFAEIVDVRSLAPGVERWKAVVLTDSATDARLLVAVSQADTDDTNRRLIWASVAVAVAGLGAFGLAGWWVVLFGLRPISDVGATARAIVSGDRTRRVEIDDPRTEAGQLAEVFNLMVDENERIERRLRRFIADASHELRTPVASIRGFADLYRRGNLEDPELLDDAMRRIGGESARMALLIDDLLLLARLDEGRPLAREHVDLDAILRDAVLDATARHPTRTIILGDARGVEVVGDEARLRQVVANLIGNSLTHGGPDATVTVSARIDGGQRVIEVVDDGAGMDAEQVARATDRFWRADEARLRRAGGAGLGLAITSAIVSAHDGELRIESERGVGTRVQVRLPGPAGPPSPAAGPRDDQNAEIQPSTTPSSGFVSSPGNR